MLHLVLIFLAHVVFILMYLFSYNLYMLGRDIIFLFLFLVSHCATLATDLYYKVIHDICLLFMLREINNLFCFTCIFHTCVYVFVKVFQEYTG